MFNKMKNEAKKQNLSMNRLALKAEITPSDLSCAINGKKPMYPNWKKRIAAVLNCTVEDLFPEEEREADNEQK